MGFFWIIFILSMAIVVIVDMNKGEYKLIASWMLMLCVVITAHKVVYDKQLEEIQRLNLIETKYNQVIEIIQPPQQGAR